MVRWHGNVYQRDYHVNIMFLSHVVKSFQESILLNLEMNYMTNK